MPGHHSTAAIVAEVHFGDFSPDASIHISDCSRKIMLEFSPHNRETHENDLHKVDTMIDVLKAFRRALLKAQRSVART